MKKLFLVACLVFVAGCGPNAFQARMADFNARLDQLTARGGAVIITSRRVTSDELSFMKQLNDNQLAAYQIIAQTSKLNDLASQEMARRNLQQVCDANTYSEAIRLLEEKARIRRESAKIDQEYKYLDEELASIERQENRRQDAVRDYMLINAIQNHH